MFNAGDYDVSSTVYLPFDSFAAATGAPSATTNFAAADIQIYKNGGTTQRSSSAGITATTSFDSQTGLQLIIIDLSDNTDAGFYAAGNRYQVAVADITVDGQTLRFWAGVFSIEIKNKTNSTQFAGQTITAAAGVTLPSSVASPTNITAGTITTVSGNVTGTVGSVVGAVGSVTGNVGGNVNGNVVGSVGSVVGAPTLQNVVDGVWNELKTAHATAGSFGANLDVVVSTRATPAQVLTTALTEAYAADGAAGTLSQILFGLQAFLQERSVAGVTQTVKKLDGAATAMTFTLDSAVTPTSITRAT